MRSQWPGYCLLVAAPAVSVALASALLNCLLGWTDAGIAWERLGPARFWLIPLLAYGAELLLLVTLNLDCKPPAQSKGDVTHLLGVKRRGTFPIPPRRRGGFPAYLCKPAASAAGMGFEAGGTSDAAMLDRLLALKRSGSPLL